MIIDYRLERATSIYILENNVNDLIKEGWQPYGSLAFDFEGHILQVMVKYEH